MITVLGFSVSLPPGWAGLGTPVVSFLATALAWVLIALLVDLLFSSVFKWATRNLPGEIEDIVLSIVRRPLVLLIGIYGIVDALKLLSLEERVFTLIQRIANTLLILILIHLLWRVIKDVLVYYGERWAHKTESRVDDVVIPALNLFGPLIILINAALVILPMWGINITSVLLGAGVVGLVLGLALQDTLSNLFSGMSLLVEAPFRTGDLVILPDGRTCEVERLGLRSTQFYSIDEHSTIFVPNKILSASALVNITKPTVEQRYSINVSVGLESNMAHVQDSLRKIAVSHPAVLVASMSEKIPLLRERIAYLRQRAEKMSGYDPVYEKLAAEADLYEQAIPKLEAEGRLNQQMMAFQSSLRNMIRGIRAREQKGFSDEELRELHENYVIPAEAEMERVIKNCSEWVDCQDPWVPDRDYWKDHKLWEDRNTQFRIRWERVKKELAHPDEKLEFRLDDLVAEMLEWLNHEYKVLPHRWKDPRVTFEEFDGPAVKLQLWFYVDNIRLEHDERPRRVKTEIARQIREQFTDEEIW